MDDRLLARFLAQPGDRTATIGLDGTAWTFDHLLGRAMKVAQQLRATGEMAGQVVLLRTDPTPLFSVADLAVLLAGGVPAVVPDLPREQLAAVWQVVAPAAVMDTTGKGGGRLVAAALEAGAAVHHVSEANSRPAGTPAQWRAVARHWAGARRDQTAALVFTSGTTGAPRAVALTEEALVRGMQTWTAQWDTNPNRTLSYLPVSHVAQRIMGHTLMCLYGTTVVASTPERLPEDLIRHRPDTLLGVPHIWARLAAAGAQSDDAGQQLRAALATVRTAINGAAALDRTVAGELGRIAELRISGAYGATETTVPTFHQTDAAVPGLGCPVGVEHRITADGEMLLRGPTLAAGDVDRWPHLRPVTDRSGWLHTGDRVRVAGDGQLLLDGRIGSRFKTAAGEMIAPEPVEAHLLTHPSVRASCLLGDGLPRSVALVCAPESAEWPPEHVAALERDLHQQIEAARRRGEVPFCDLAAVRVLDDSWPELQLVTSTGKPHRDRIATHYHHLLTRTLEPARART
ncbi:AMP-binding protein [Streptomyces sp. MS1.AVA.3]|uniref:AMP-binding protein n=1 Tax=Streptomyces decoyicus TaxID=249567 RepID=UPI0030C3B20D